MSPHHKAIAMVETLQASMARIVSLLAGASYNTPAISEICAVNSCLVALGDELRDLATDECDCEVCDDARTVGALTFAGTVSTQPASYTVAELQQQISKLAGIPNTTDRCRVCLSRAPVDGWIYFGVVGVWCSVACRNQEHSNG